MSLIEHLFPADITKLFCHCMTSSYFMWGGNFYEQTDGVAMGSPLSPVVATFFMEHFEEEAIASAPLKPMMWWRYVDDAFVVWIDGPEKLHLFLNHLNQQYPSIKFTMEMKSDVCLPFLDVLPDKSARAEHVLSSGHDVMFQDARALTHIRHYRSRIIREAVEIRRNPNDFNRETGYQMVAIMYNTFIAASVFLMLVLLPLVSLEQETERGRGQGRSPVKRRQQIKDGAVSFVKPHRKRRPVHAEFPNIFSTIHPVTPSSTSLERDAKFLNLFTVIQFPNQGCAASSGDNGTCLTAAECTERGGIASGPCANGYGVCCVFIAMCGQNVRENITYFVNNGYPGPYDGTGSCQLTVNKIHPDVCQIRLDFDQFNIAGPEPVNNVCTNDQFIVSGGNPVPAICGINTGNHMYIDTGLGSTNPVTLTFVTSGPSFARNFKVKVSQIPCSSIYRAEEGCLQYFTGVSGQIKSFNYDPGSGLQLSNQDYSICIRMERNFCGIQYSTAPDTVNNRSHAFTLTGNTLSRDAIVSSSVSSMGSFPCVTDWLGIPCASNVGRRNASGCVDRICGGTFNAEISTTPSAVYSTVKPFRLYFHTDATEAPTDVGNRGFALNYVQQPCTNNL
ncbi:uncharacterized protein [Anabrus simplex]|uniref:uncharacterized protein n=1 Tax=Anabrus simplex TaxID=316456 RepID=UPI0035A2AA87